MVGIMSLCLFALLIWAIVRRPVDPLVSWAVIAGMVLVVAGLGIGQWLIELGNDFAAANGIVPETVTNGDAGTPKFPHAIAFHGIQAFIISALALRRSDTSEDGRSRLMKALVASYSALLAFASAQSILGVAPTGTTPGGTATPAPKDSGSANISASDGTTSKPGWRSGSPTRTDMAHIRRHPVDNSKWQVRYIDPTGRERSKVFPRKVDAERFLIHIEAQKQRAEWINPELSSTLFEDWAEGWLANRTHLKPKTFSGYESLLKVHILPRFGSSRLDRIDSLSIEEWIADLKASGLSASRIRQAHNVLSQILKTAVRSRYLPTNYAEGIDLPRKPRREQLFLTPVEVDRLAAKSTRSTRHSSTSSPMEL
jgi:hypothetical protein